MRSAIAALVLVVALGGSAAADESNPHKMLGPDGKLDMTACDVCHDDDLSLSRSLLDTCTLCHPVDTHAGSGLHVRANAAAVARVVPTPGAGGPELPLTSEGTIWCGTCHLFHDPALGGEQPLAQAWVPPRSGLPGAVADALTARWEAMRAKAGATESVAHLERKGITALRLPVSDGRLCLHCHGSVVK